MNIVRIDRNALPQEEHASAESIEHNLLTLEMNAEEFRQTAGLYRFAHTRKQVVPAQARDMIGLVKIAGRNGAVVVSSFFEVTQALNATKAPTLWSKADMDERAKATKLFADSFPQISRIRKSAAHPGELGKSEVEQQKHRLRGPITHPAIQSAGGTHVESMMHATLDGLDFGASFLGEYVEYRLSMASADALDAVANHYRQTFYPLEEAAQQREWIQESDRRRKLDQMSRLPWWHSLTQP